MIIEAGKFGDASNFSVPFIEAVKSMSDGDTLSFEKKNIIFTRISANSEKFILPTRTVLRTRKNTLVCS